MKKNNFAKHYVISSETEKSIRIAREALHRLVQGEAAPQFFALHFTFCVLSFDMLMSVLLSQSIAWQVEDSRSYPAGIRDTAVRSHRHFHYCYLFRRITLHVLIHVSGVQFYSECI